MMFSTTVTAGITAAAILLLICHSHPIDPTITVASGIMKGLAPGPVQLPAHEPELLLSLGRNRVDQGQDLSVALVTDTAVARRPPPLPVPAMTYLTFRRY